jgi:D-xylose 1-dehydrogenase (NADP+, D-xylono-1,5-lactone-forming)
MEEKGESGDFGRDVAAIEPVRWGILGCANIARGAFIPALRSSRSGTAVAIASRDGAKAGQWAQEFGIAQAWGSYEALLADPAVEAVYIPLPNSMHAAWIERAAAAGKHVFCEKPLTASAAEAERALEICRRQGVLLYEAFVYRFQPQTALVRRLLDEGRIGQVRAATAKFHFKLRERVHNVRMKADLAGGALMDVGCYCIDWLRWLMGEPESVYARGEFTRGVDTVCQGILDFGGGRSAVFSTGFEMAGGQGAVIHGEDGEIELTVPWHPRGEAAAVIVRTGPGQEEVHRVTPDVPVFLPAVEAFSTALREGRSLPVGPEEGLRNLRTIEAVRRSMQSGRRESV